MAGVRGSELVLIGSKWIGIKYSEKLAAGAPHERSAKATPSKARAVASAAHTLSADAVASMPTQREIEALPAVAAH